jgi:hypothetical protein
MAGADWARSSTGCRPTSARRGSASTGPDGSRAMSSGRPTFLSAAARQQWIRGGRPRELPGYNGSLLPNAFIRPYAAAGLPTNVDALWQLLYRETGNGGAAWKRRAARAGPQGVSARLVRYSPGPAASSSISAASRSSRSGASSCSAGGSEA